MEKDSKQSPPKTLLEQAQPIAVAIALISGIASFLSNLADDWVFIGAAVVILAMVWLVRRNSNPETRSGWSRVAVFALPMLYLSTVLAILHFGNAAPAQEELDMKICIAQFSRLNPGTEINTLIAEDIGKLSGIDCIRGKTIAAIPLTEHIVSSVRTGSGRAPEIDAKMQEHQIDTGMLCMGDLRNEEFIAHIYLQNLDDPSAMRMKEHIPLHNPHQHDFRMAPRRQAISAAMRGITLYYFGCMTEADALLDQALAADSIHDPEFQAVMHFYKGNSAYNQKDFARAISSYERALSLDSTDLHAKHNLGRAHAATNNIPVAQRLLTEVYEADWNNEFTVDSALLAMNSTPDALHSNEDEFTDTYRAAHSDVRLKRFRKRGKYGYVNSLNNDTLLPAIYDIANKIKGPLAKIGLNRDGHLRYGMINDRGQVLIEPTLDTLFALNERPIKIGFKGKQGFVNADGSEVIPAIYDEIFRWYDGLAKFRQNRLIGYLGTDFQVAIPAIYKQGHNFHEGVAMVKKGALWAPINTEGKFLFPPTYANAREHNEGVCMVQLPTTKKWGGIDLQNNEVIPFIYTNAKKFSENRVCVLFNKGWGAIDRESNIVLPFSYTSLFEFENNLVLSKATLRSKPCKVINELGETAFTCPCSIDKHKRIFNNRKMLYADGLYGFTDANGNIVIEPAFKKATNFAQGAARVSRNGNAWKLIDVLGKRLTAETFSSIDAARNSVVIVYKNNKYGALSTSGTELLPVVFSQIRSTRYNLILGKLGGFWYAYSKTGKLLVEDPLVEVHNYVDERIWVKANSHWGALDKNGAIAVPFNFKIVDDFEQGTALVQRETGGKIRIDKFGKETTLSREQRLFNK